MSIEHGSTPANGPGDDWAAQIRRAKSEKRSKKWIGAAAASGLVLVLTVGGATLVNVMGGGGPQPEDVLPANAVAFVKLDLNPSAGQKVAAYRLAAKFPKIKSKVTSESTSIKESIFGTLFTGDTKTGAMSMGLKYKTDVEPWLGDRAGVGVFPDLDADKKPEFGLALAFTNQAAAKAALDKAIAYQTKTNRAENQSTTKQPKANQIKIIRTLSNDTATNQTATNQTATNQMATNQTATNQMATNQTATNQTKTKQPKTKPTMGYAFADAFVVVSDTTAHAAALVAAGKAASLATSTYAEDVRKLGEDQVAIAWIDIAATFKAVKSGFPESMTKPMKMDESKMAGRVVEGLHLDPSFLEVTAMGFNVKGATAVANADAGADASLIESFPSGVLGAFTANGLGKSAGALYTSLDKAAEKAAKSGNTATRVSAINAGASDPLGLTPFTNQCFCRVKSILSSLGLDSAKKIESLLGSETGVMVGGDKLGKPQVAIRTRGSNPDAAVGVARKALARVPGGLQIRKIAGPPGIVIGPAPAGHGLDLVKETLSTSGSKLGADEAFRQVIPADQKASFVAFVNLSKVLPLIDKQPRSDLDMATLKPFKALGFTAVGGSDPTVRLRVSFK